MRLLSSISNSTVNDACLDLMFQRMNSEATSRYAPARMLECSLTAVNCDSGCGLDNCFQAPASGRFSRAGRHKYNVVRL